MLPEVDLYNVLQFCAALLMIAVTIGLCAFVVGVVVSALKSGQDKD